MSFCKGLSFAQNYALPTLMSWLPKRMGSAYNLLEEGGLRMCCYRAWPQEPRVLSAWDDLAARCQASTAFHMPDWQLPLLRQAMHLGRMRLLIVFRGERSVGHPPIAKPKRQST